MPIARAMIAPWISMPLRRSTMAAANGTGCVIIAWETVRGTVLAVSGAI
jgi:hypothetical protein